jgi:hypothetical protein
MTNYTQIRIALGLTEEQAASLVNAAAYERGVGDGVERILKALDCGSVQEAVASREKLVTPNMETALLADGVSVEGEGAVDA